jgi:hypothetical protein
MARGTGTRNREVDCALSTIEERICEIEPKGIKIVRGFYRQRQQIRQGTREKSLVGGPQCHFVLNMP